MLTVGTDRRAALEAWGDWLSDGWDFSWFVTMTFDPKRVAIGSRTSWGWAATDRAWDQLIDRVSMSSEAGGAPSLWPVWWVRGREPHHDSGGTHFHGLVGGIPETVSRRDTWAWAKQHFGMNRIEPYNPTRGAAHYLTKYVVKQLGDVRFSDNFGNHRKETGNGG